MRPQILILITAMVFAFAWPSQAQQTMPPFELDNLNGERINSKQWSGQILVIHIATTWCPFCNAEAPHLQALQEAYADRNVQVIIIDVKEGANLVRAKLKDHHQLTFPILLDSDGAVAASLAPAEVLPDLARDEVMLASNLIVDQQGVIRYMSLLDTRNFDAKLVNLKARLDELLQNP